MTDTPITTAAQMQEAAVNTVMDETMSDADEWDRECIADAIRAIPCAGPDVQVGDNRVKKEAECAEIAFYAAIAGEGWPDDTRIALAAPEMTISDLRALCRHRNDLMRLAKPDVQVKS